MHDLPKNWLVFRLSALGDVVLTSGPMRHWHNAHGWRFHVLTKEVFAPVFDNNPVVERVVTAAPADLAMPRMRAWFAELARAYAGWGLLDLHGTMRSSLLGMFWKGPVRRYAKYGFARRAFLLSGGRLGGETLRAVNVPQRYALAVEETAPPARELVPAMYLAEREQDWAKSFLANLFGDDVLRNASGNGGCVAVHPFASHSHKAWPRGSYERLLALLDARGIPWIVLGRGEALRPGNPGDLTNATSLRESAALLGASSALVTADSGPMHLATAVGTPVVGLFGPTTREWGFFPSGPQDRVLEHALPCRPCSLHGKKGCTRNGECLSLTEPETVVAALGEILACNGRN